MKYIGYASKNTMNHTESYHCRYSENFIGFAHIQSIIQRRSLLFIATVAHNLSNYELHRFCVALHSCTPDNSTKIILQRQKKEFRCH